LAFPATRARSSWKKRARARRFLLLRSALLFGIDGGLGRRHS
jgi:hypothetical protein